MRVRSQDGGPWDLLLSTTLGRRLPLPRRDVRSGLHSSIAAFASPRGRLLVGARHVGGRFLLAVATPHGPWRPFAEPFLEDAEVTDQPVTFEPVHNAVPGLDVPPRWRRLSEPAYAGSRRGRR